LELAMDVVSTDGRECVEEFVCPTHYTGSFRIGALALVVLQPMRHRGDIERRGVWVLCFAGEARSCGQVEGVRYIVLFA